MSMVTTCTHCATSFNVEAEVLLSRDGRVRCGQCKKIFDGFLSATTREEFEAAAPGTASPMPEGVAPPPAASAALPEAFEASDTSDTSDTYWPALPEVPEVPTPPMPLEIAAAASGDYFDVADTPDAASDAEVSALPLSAPITQIAPITPITPITHRAPDAEPDQDTFEAAHDAEPKRRHRGWAVAATLAALLLAGQVTYRYRSELAAHVPVVKPALAQVCAWAGCRVPPLQQPASLNIEASDLQVVDKTRPHLVQLTATLRNRADIDVGYPAFDLVLTDNREHALARRVIVPKDYLPGAAANAAQPAQATIAAHAEVTVRVDMDVSSLPAAGFRLNLTSAPSN